MGGHARVTVRINLKAIRVTEWSMRVHFRAVRSHKVMESKAEGIGVMQGSIREDVEEIRDTECSRRATLHVMGFHGVRKSKSGISVVMHV